MFSLEDVLEIAREVINGSLAPNSIEQQQGVRDRRGKLVDDLRQAILIAIVNAGQDETLGSKWIDLHLPRSQLLKSIAAPFLDQTGWERISQRQSAVHRLVEAHMPLAEKWARRAMRQPDDVTALLNEAVLILMAAVDRFDPANGNRFSTYADAALRNELHRRSPSGTALRRNTQSALRQVNVARADLMQRHQRSVTDEEVEAFLDFTPQKYLQIENVRQLLLVLRQQDGVNPTQAQHADYRFADPYEQVVTKELRDLLQKLLRVLPDFERQVFVGKVLEGLSFREMAKLHRCRQDKVSKAYDFARQALKRRLGAFENHSPR
ncbi:MAG TPA: sigma-70 family RNA polymerase sigma factor [Pirellulales bacterium]|nr:sigma-70 family RNA polymerase sigma factor [Pirellulales bacterium]